MSEEKKVKYETTTPVEGKYKEHALSALSKFEKFHEEQRMSMSDIDKIIDERMFNYYFSEDSIVELDERVVPSGNHETFHPFKVRQYIGKRGVVKKYYSDIHAFGRGYSYQMDVRFDGELFKGLPAYYFIDKTEEYLEDPKKYEELMKILNKDE